MKARKLDTTTDYVYDACVNSKHQNFYGNGFLLHNTDSSYFTFKGTPVEDVSEVESVAKAVLDRVNESFPLFMKTHFNVPEEMCVIEASLEIIGRRGLFVTKKRYAVYCDNVKDENKRLKMKGFDAIRADTSPLVKDFLAGVMKEILEHGMDDPEKYRRKIIEKYKELMKEYEPWELGTPTSVQNADNYWSYFAMNDPRIPKNERIEIGTRFFTKDEDKQPSKKPNLYGAYNWNVLAKYVYKDPTSPLIKSGDRIILCKIVNDEINGEWVAYPADIEELPEWFKSLPFDKEKMVEKIFLKKLENMFPRNVFPEFHFDPKKVIEEDE